MSFPPGHDAAAINQSQQDNAGPSNYIDPYQEFANLEVARTKINAILDERKQKLQEVIEKERAAAKAESELKGLNASVLASTQGRKSASKKKAHKSHKKARVSKKAKKARKPVRSPKRVQWC